MKITLIQDNICWADKKSNLQRLEQYLSALYTQTELVVLPEMFSTGFCIHNKELAESIEGETVRTLISLAKKYQLAITGSFIALEDNKMYNRSFFVFPSGELQFSDKRHLFSVGGEHEFFNEGNKKLIVHYKGFNICVLVCYDIRFPVWSRNVKNEYDVLIYVANFPEKRIVDWDILLKARAIENQCFVCGVNRIGKDGQGISYNGHSVLLDYNASTLLTFPEQETSIQTFDLQLEPLVKYRERFPVWKDADQFKIL